MHISFSILIPTIPSRRAQFATLVTALERQSEGLPVEVLGLYDNKTRTLGDKRNALLEMATGSHLVFIDDDDRVAADYVPTIAEVIRKEDPDLIVYEQEVRAEPPDPPIRCRYGVELRIARGPGWWQGKPAHTMVWRSSIAKQGRFPGQNFAEDNAWVDQVRTKVNIAKQVRIDRVLYYYEFDPSRSETR